MNRHYIEDVINRDDKMDIDLTDIGIEEGQKYEGIYTTMSRDGVKNAAPIGIVCKGKDKLGCRLFVGTQTLKNIMETRRYVVNITFDPINFVNSTIGNLDIEEFTDDDDIAILKNAEAYVICDVTDIRKMDPIKDHVTSNGEAYIITSDVVEIVKNHPCAKALNRGVFALLECLTNYTRLDLVSKQQQDYFIGRFNENNRMIKRVSGSDTIKAMEILKNSMIEKGFDVE